MSIDLRRAEIAKLYSKAKFAIPKAGVQSLKSNIDCVDLQEVKLKGINVIYGVNGSGKTLFLKSLAENNKCFNFFNTELTLANSPSFVYFSPSDAVVKLKEVIRKIGDTLMVETLEQYSPISLNDDDVSQINYVIGTNYTSIDIFEIDDQDEDYIYIKVIENENERHHTDLSDGEVYCIKLFWFLKFKLEERHLLIDEPESYLYPKAQVRLIELLLMLVNISNQQIFIATHSKDIVFALESSKLLKLIKQSNDSFIFDIGEPCDQLLGEMGLATHKSKIIFVEDSKAKAFLHLLIGKCIDYSLQNLLILSVKNGEGDLSSILNRITEGDRSDVLLCYDADAIEKELIPKEVAEHAISLPGALPPEQELIFAIGQEEEKFITSFDMDKRVQVIGGLAQLKGQNHHDFFEELSRILIIDKWYIFERAFNVWHDGSNNSEKVYEFISKLRAYL